MGEMAHIEYRVTSGIWRDLLEELKRRKHPFQWQDDEDGPGTIGACREPYFFLEFDPPTERVIMNWCPDEFGRSDRWGGMKLAVEVEKIALALGAKPRSGTAAEMEEWARARAKKWTRRCWIWIWTRGLDRKAA